MGIESDQLVYDYLSRVGDLAQQRQLPASERMRLVSTLRNEIDRRRATHGEESPAAVRGILGALGTPDEVVERAESPGESPPVPKPREETGPGRPTGRRVPGSRRPGDGAGAGGSGSASGGSAAGASASGKSAPGRSLFGRSAPGEAAPSRPAPGKSGSGKAAPSRPASGKSAPGKWSLFGKSASGSTAQDGARAAGQRRPDGAVSDTSGVDDPATSPGGLGADLGIVDDGATDWWQEDAAEGLAGFVGGVERPDLFKPPTPDDEEGDEEGEAEEDAAPGKRRRLARILRRRRPEATEAEPEAEPEPEAAPASRLRLANPFVLLAALLLIGGAVFGSLVALAAGWLIAYASRRLTPGEIKAAVLVIPGLAAASGIVWLWGRVEGRWGAAVAPGGEAMGAALSETWPWVLRGAAIASALFLLWRSRRH